MIGRSPIVGHDREGALVEPVGSVAAELRHDSLHDLRAVVGINAAIVMRVRETKPVTNLVQHGAESETAGLERCRRPQGRVGVEHAISCPVPCAELAKDVTGELGEGQDERRARGDGSLGEIECCNCRECRHSRHRSCDLCSGPRPLSCYSFKGLTGCCEVDGDVRGGS